MSAKPQSDTMPEFRLPASTGQTLESDAFVGKMPLVVVFLADLESAEAQRHVDRYNDRLKDFGQETCQVLVVARSTARRVREISEDQGWNLPLLADAGGEMARSFGVVGATGETEPTTLLVDRRGSIVRRFDDSGMAGEAEALLTAVRSLGANYLTPPE